jgi:uncharacterized protein (TIGR00730 family)
MRVQDKDVVLGQIDDFLSQFEGLGASDILRQSVWTLLRLHGSSNSTRHDALMVRRILRELRMTVKVFSKFKDVRKVAIFGSARTLPSDPSYQMAEEFARKITHKGFMIITGAGGGIMEAGNRGAAANMDFGVNIDLPFEQDPNPFIADDPKLVNYHYFFTRKLTFVRETDGTVLFPGGFGTHDECFETLTLIQTGRAAPRPVLMVAPAGDDYWDKMHEFIREKLELTGLISPEDMALYKVVHSVDEAVYELIHFYRVYHSIRYIGDKTVMRLNTFLSEETLAYLHDHFSHLLVEGMFRQCTSAETPEDCVNFPSNPRLVFNFNMKDYGTLTQMIHYLNSV